MWPRLLQLMKSDACACTGASPDRVRYRERSTGEIHTEQVPAERWLRWLYWTRSGRVCAPGLFVPGLISTLLGWWQKSRWSRRDIRRFAALHGVNLDEMADPPAQLDSFNAFFTRRLKPGVRSFAAEPDVLCSPADGRALVFPCLNDGMDFPVKGARVTPAELLNDRELAAAYDRGAALVVRLAPVDYHRFHFIDDALARPSRDIAGRRDSVNPIAQRRVPTVFARNKRSVTPLETTGFGPVVQVEIGAFGVASIVQTYSAGPVARGQEKGYFQFGGSALVLLFRQDTIVFDKDLEVDSAAGLETRVRTGEQLGRALLPEGGAVQPGRDVR